MGYVTRSTRRVDPGAGAAGLQWTDDAPPRVWKAGPHDCAIVEIIWATIAPWLVEALACGITPTAEGCMSNGYPAMPVAQPAVCTYCGGARQPQRRSLFFWPAGPRDRIGMGAENGWLTFAHCVHRAVGWLACAISMLTHFA